MTEQNEQSPITEALDIGSLVPVSLWPHRWPSQSSWRHLVFDSDINGLDDYDVLVRIGTMGKRKRILVNEAKFGEWLKAANEGRVKLQRTDYK